MNYQGYLIYRTRIQRNWSQAGLCKGICAVSYLSKIETGKAEPSEEIIQLLMERLDLKCDKRTVWQAPVFPLDNRHRVWYNIRQRQRKRGD